MLQARAPAIHRQSILPSVEDSMAAAVADDGEVDGHVPMKMIPEGREGQSGRGDVQNFRQEAPEHCRAGAFYQRNRSSVRSPLRHKASD